MKTLLTSSVATVALAAAAMGQIEEVYSIDRPAGTLFGWGHSLTALEDVDGDGTADLAVGVFGHGGGQVAVIYSGATGALLYDLEAAYQPLFWGDGVTSVVDETGDGVPELVVLGSHSGDPNSPDGSIQVHSGADGSLLRQVAPPTGMFLQAHTQLGATSPGDVDGDGHGDVLCYTAVQLSGGTRSLTLLSGLTGQPIFDVTPPSPAGLLGDHVVLLSDHDHDGRADLAVVVNESWERHLEIRSGATGAFIAQLDVEGIDVLTGNGEPLISVADADGDGLRDFALGSVFSGYAGLYSSADGALLQSWECSAGEVECLGSRLCEVGDLSGDGHPDMIAFESEVFGSDGMRLFGLDPLTGAVLFEHFVPGLAGGYSNSERITPLPGVDPLGFPTFALFEGLLDRVTVQRGVPELGTCVCTSTPNSTGAAATLRAYGSTSLSTGHFSLRLEQAPALEYGVFAFGSELRRRPFGGGFLCVSGQVGRFHAAQTDEAGCMELLVDLAGLDIDSVTQWNFQAVFRDTDAGGMQTSEAVRVEIIP